MVRDSVKAKGENTIRQYFHLSPDSIVRKLSPDIVEAESGGVFLYTLLDRGFSIEIKKGETDPVMGWSSAIFGKKIESPVLVNTAMIEDSGEFDTVLYVSRKRMSLEQLGDIFEKARIK